MLHTTLTLLRRFNACGQTTADGSYNKLRASLPADLTDDTPITLLHVLESNGIEDAIWALRATAEPTGKNMAAEMAIRSAERVQYLFDKKFPNDSRIRECNEATRAYGRGEITLGALREKQAAAAAAYSAAAADAAADAAYSAAADAAAREADYRELLTQF